MLWLLLLSLKVGTGMLVEDNSEGVLYVEKESPDGVDGFRVICYCVYWVRCDSRKVRKVRHTVEFVSMLRTASLSPALLSGFLPASA